MNSITSEIAFITRAVFATGVRDRSVSALAEIAKLLPQIGEYSQDNSLKSITNVDNVDRLKNVLPTDRVYEALRNLAACHYCISSFANDTFQGSKSLVSLVINLRQD